MKKTTCVVSDTSPIISLAILDMLHLFEKIFTKVYIPEAVWHELTSSKKTSHNLKIKAFFENKIKHINSANNLLPLVDLGESEAIILCKEINADFLIIDDLKARQIAEEIGINCVGTLGLLFKAKEKGYIKELRKYFVLLIENNRYYSITILNKLLDLSNETPLNINSF